MLYSGYNLDIIKSDVPLSIHLKIISLCLCALPYLGYYVGGLAINIAIGGVKTDT
jgi:hypothetical protein